MNTMGEMKGSAIKSILDVSGSRVAHTTRQPHVTCSSGSSEGSDVARHTCNALNDARTVESGGVDRHHNVVT